MQIVDGAAVVAGVDDGHGGAGEAREVLPAAGLFQRLVVLEVGLECHRVRGLTAPDHVQHSGIDTAMHGQKEVFRLQEVYDQMDRLVVDENRPEKRLLGLQVFRRLPVTFRLPELDHVAHAATCGWARGGASSAIRFRAVSA